MSVDALIAWAAAGGATLGPIEIRVGADGNRSVFARRAIAAGETLLAVPRSLMIGDTDVAATPVGAAMQSFATMLYSRYMPLATWVALERSAATTSWAPFLDALPLSFTAWTRDAVAGLEGTRAGELVEQRTRELEEDRQLLTDMIGGLESLLPERLDWGLRIARSRCFEVAATGGRALVPVADMFDHAAIADAMWSYRTDESRFEVRAAHSLSPDDEIRINYGIADNAHWLTGYGFVLENNPDDEVTLRFAGDTSRVCVGTRFDARFQRAWQAAGVVSADDEPGSVLRVLNESVRQADERIAAGVADFGTDPCWARTCRIVRAGERKVLAEIAAFLARAMELIDRGPEQRAVSRSVPEDSIGAERLLRGFLSERV